MKTNFFSSLSFVDVFGSWIRDPGSEIRDPGWVKIRIRDKHPVSATLLPSQYFPADSCNHPPKTTCIGLLVPPYGSLPHTANFIYTKGVTKKCRVWPIAPSEPKCRRREELRGLSQWVRLCTWSPNKLWISNSIFNLWSISNKHSDRIRMRAYQKSTELSRNIICRLVSSIATNHRAEELAETNFFFKIRINIWGIILILENIRTVSPRADLRNINS